MGLKMKGMLLELIKPDGKRYQHTNYTSDSFKVVKKDQMLYCVQRAMEIL